MKKQDGLTIIDSKPLIPLDKIRDKTLDQMSFPERADLLREAYHHIESTDNVTDDEMKVIGMLTEKLETKVISWGLVVKKISEAAELCTTEQAYYQQKVDAAKARAERFKKKTDAMGEYIKAKMMEFNLKKIESPLVTVSLRKRPQKVEFIGEPNIESPEHADFTTTVSKRTWDKKTIKSKLDEGQMFRTVKLSDPDFSILIKGS